MSETASRAIIVTFSQTGNTRRVAEAVARGLRAKGLAVDLADLLSADPAATADYDLVGIGAPVFYYKEPANVRAFIDRLPDGRRKAAFTFITHGGNPVNTLRRMQKRLARRGHVVLNSFSCTGYDTYPMFFRTFREWGHPSADDLAAAQDFGERLANECRWFRDEQRFATPKYRFVGGKYFVLSLLCNGGMMKRMFPALKVREDLCTRCGTCARTCPTGAITLSPYPKIDEKCLWCYQCERICPEQALDADWSPLRKKMNV
jgi:flavodoxin/NAD-dependent dihydropyrimidine dehydrogenase PreA subunit